MKQAPKVGQDSETNPTIETQWIQPDFSVEADEIERVALLLAEGITENIQPHAEVLRKALDNGHLQPLGDELWRNLENTDSWDKVVPGAFDVARKLAEAYQRDFETLYQAMTKGKALQAPIIVIKPDKTPHLLSGNTRLMIARALGQRPQVWVAEVGS